jgi:hypothetical protein
MRVTQPFGEAQGLEPVERQMGVFRQPLKGLLRVRFMDMTLPKGFLQVKRDGLGCRWRGDFAKQICIWGFLLYNPLDNIRAIY